MIDPTVPSRSLPDGSTIAALGLGSCRLGLDWARRREDIALVKSALDLGYRLIETSESYAEGGAEKIVGDAIAGRRQEVFVVGKVLPQNAWVKAARLACERSLANLRTDHIDLYLVEGRGPVSLPEMLEAMERLVAAGKIRRWGVSGLGLAELIALWRIPDGSCCALAEAHFSLTQRSADAGLLPWLRRHQRPLMATGPLDQGRLATHPALAAVARRHGASAAQIALAWLLAQPGVIALAQTSQPGHLNENLGAARIRLSAEDLAALAAAFPAPHHAAAAAAPTRPLK